MIRLYQYKSKRLVLLWMSDSIKHTRQRMPFFNKGENTMSKSQDTKKAVKKEPAKTPKEKKAEKKIKKAEKAK